MRMLFLNPPRFQMTLMLSHPANCALIAMGMAMHVGDDHDHIESFQRRIPSYHVMWR